MDNTVFQINGFSRLSLLKAAEMAQILNIGMSLAFRLRQCIELSPVRLGRVVRVKPTQLEQLIASKSRDSTKTE